MTENTGDAGKASVRVKPLEWLQQSDGRYADGFRPGAYLAEYYFIAPATDGTYRLDDGRFTFFRLSFESVAEAQRAAQAHYEDRILAALSPPVKQPDRVAALEAENARLREALDPFVKMAKALWPVHGSPRARDDAGIWGFDDAILTHGDFRRAEIAALSTKGEA